MTDHPRMCGEKASVAGEGTQYDWITPACAGKRHKKDALGVAKIGSPPHVRGKG